jgi:hypothetical protein
MRRLYLIAGIGVFLFLYLKFGVPWITDLATTSGVKTAFLIFLAFYCAFAYMAGAIVGHGPKAFAIFITAFLVADIWLFPMMIPYDHPPTGLTPEQQISSDVFFYQVYSDMGVGHTTAWWLTYLFTPLAFLLLFAYELKASVISRHIPRLMI